MTRTPETLTDLVAACVGEGRPLTYRLFEARAVDPVTGYRPSKGTLWKVAKDQPIKLSPDLIRAIAAGLGLPPERAQRAAAFQYTGYVATDLDGGTLVHQPAAAVDLSKAKKILARWDREEQEGAGDRSANSNITR
jgi:hypothetical protein